MNVLLYNSQFNKLKSGMKYGTEATLDLSSNVIGDFNDRTNFPHKLLWTDTQALKIHKAFTNGSAANIKLLNTQLSEIVQ